MVKSKIFYSLVATCNLNRINPYEYFVSVQLTHLSELGPKIHFKTFYTRRLKMGRIDFRSTGAIERYLTT